MRYTIEKLPRPNSVALPDAVRTLEGEIDEEMEVEGEVAVVGDEEYNE